MIPKVVFIPLCNMSSWLHNELRIALRSWEKFYPQLETVCIIGYKPDWLINVHHIEFSGVLDKVQEIFKKTKIAAEHYPEFIFANDDHFLLQPLIELPYYCSVPLKEFKGPAGDTFFRYVDTTYRLFPDGKYFDIHTPMIVKREILDTMDWKKDVLFKSYYGNTGKVDGLVLKDCKINGFVRRDEIDRYVIDRPFISTGEAISTDLKKFLFEKFPEKSRFEM